VIIYQFITALGTRLRFSNGGGGNKADARLMNPKCSTIKNSLSAVAVSQKVNSGANTYFISLCKIVKSDRRSGVAGISFALC